LAALNGSSKIDETSHTQPPVCPEQQRRPSRDAKCRLSVHHIHKFSLNWRLRCPFKDALTPDSVCFVSPKNLTPLQTMWQKKQKLKKNETNTKTQNAQLHGFNVIKIMRIFHVNYSLL